MWHHCGERVAGNDDIHSPDLQGRADEFIEVSDCWRLIGDCLLRVGQESSTYAQSRKACEMRIVILGIIIGGNLAVTNL